MRTHNYEYYDTSNVCLGMIYEGDKLRVMFVQHKSSASKNVRYVGSIAGNGKAYSLAPLF